jgi:alkylation response protein AidB-like acyl-CoA dehydrogenase
MRRTDVAIVTQDVDQPMLPAPNVDFCGLAKTQPVEELATLKQVRDCLESKVAPGINKYWAEDAFPFELLPAIKELNLMGAGLPGDGCGSALLLGVIATKRARPVASIATFMGVHSGQAMCSIDFGGLEEQKKRWLPPIDLELDFKNRVLYWTGHGDPACGNRPADVHDGSRRLGETCW